MSMASKGVRVQATTRLPVDLHRTAAVEARRRRMTLNDLVVVALRQYLDADVTAQPGERGGIYLYDDEGQRVGMV